MATAQVINSFHQLSFVNRTQSGANRIKPEQACSICAKKVYALECIAIGDKRMHETCFKCSVCKRKLKASSFKSLQGLFYCEAHYHTTLNRVGGKFSEFSSDTPHGPFFDMLCTDVIIEILSWLEDNDVAKLASVCKSFSSYSGQALKLFPFKPNLSPANYYYSSGYDREYTFFCHKREKVAPLTSWTVRITPSSLAPCNQIVEYNYPPAAIEETLNLISFAHEDYELPIKINLIARVGRLSSVSKTYSSHVHPISVHEGRRHIYAGMTGWGIENNSPGCFETSALIKMADGSKKRAGDIKLGDVVLGGDLKPHEVIHIRRNEGPLLGYGVVKLGNFIITRGHPILVDKEWYRPDELYDEVKLTLEDGIVNFVISGDNKTIIVGGNEGTKTLGIDVGEFICSTLGCFCGDRLNALYPENNKEFSLRYQS